MSVQGLMLHMLKLRRYLGVILVYDWHIKDLIFSSCINPMLLNKYRHSILTKNNGK